MDVDPIRRFLWEVGNGTTEYQLCQTLGKFFHNVCPLADVLDKEICQDYKSAYEARCSASANRLAREGTFLYLAIVLFFCFVLASLLKAKGILFIPDSAVTITVGALTGALFVVSQVRGKHSFNHQIFFEVLLPFIIFEAGYNMDKRLLRKNFGAITGLAVIGTLISFAVTTGMMAYGNALLGTGLSLLDCSVFGALMSSTDPVAIVNIFAALGVDPKIYALVLGESALNDGIAVALYTSMKHFYAEPDLKDADALIYVLWSFALVSVGSSLIGFGFASLTAFFWKTKGRHWFKHPVIETLAYLTTAIVPYYVADALHWSGIIAIMVASISLSIYAHGNLTPTSQLHVIFVVECIARLCEAVMFGYVGTQIVANNGHMTWTPLVFVALLAVLVARALAVFPIMAASNLRSVEKVPFSNQVVIWFSGLRGALSFALAITVPSYDTVLEKGSHHNGDILACACFVIMINVFCMGALAPSVLRRCVRSNHIVAREAPTERDTATGLLQKVHSKFLIPCLTREREDEVTRAHPDISAVLSPLLQGDDLTQLDENALVHAEVDIPSEEQTIVFPRSRLVPYEPDALGHEIRVQTTTLEHHNEADDFEQSLL